MRNLMAWSLLLAIFLLAGEGLNLFRIHINEWLAFGNFGDAIWAVAGLAIACLGTAFLGGFVYHRDKKRGKLKREGWRGRPIERQEKERIPKT